MTNDKVIQFLSLTFLFLASFFFLVININYYTSSLVRENTRLQSTKQNLENNLQTTRLNNNSDLDKEIENNLDVGNITRIDGNQSVDITDIQVKPSAPIETPAEEQVTPSGNPSVTIR